MATTEAPRQIPDGYAAQTEGQATILQKGNEVFYNPAQVVNRDLSIAVINYFAEQRRKEAGNVKSNRAARANAPPPGRGLHILEGLAASGLRSIRYAKELDDVENVIANDLDPTVVEAMKRNIEFNHAADKVTPSVGDARIIMMKNPAAYDVVDLDPYGSPAILLDAAVQAVSHGGLLCVTATDMAVLCGNNGETCFSKYGSYPLHKPYCHEMAVRIVLASIATAAARHKRTIVPVLSCSIDFYVRMFVRVYTSAQDTKDTASKLAYVYQSTGCDSFYWQRLGRKLIKGNSIRFAPGTGPAVPEKCPETGAGFTMGGPFWAESIHDQEWARGILSFVRGRRERFAAFEKIQALLTACAEELPDAPLYLNLHDVFKTIKATPMRMETFKSALINGGYKVSSTHCTPLGVKTNAPWNIIWDLMRCWIQDHPIKNIQAGSAAESILGKEPEFKANFSRVPEAVVKKKKGNGKKTPRYPQNPQNWGPKMKHGRTGRGSGRHQDNTDGATAVADGEEAKIEQPATAMNEENTL